MNAEKLAARLKAIMVTSMTLGMPMVIILAGMTEIMSKNDVMGSADEGAISASQRDSEFILGEFQLYFG